MTAEGRLAPASGADALIARLENVPFSRWHLRPRVVVGTATFFDAFDALSLAFVLPVLAPGCRRGYPFGVSDVRRRGHRGRGSGRAHAGDGQQTSGRYRRLRRFGQNRLLQA